LRGRRHGVRRGSSDDTRPARRLAFLPRPRSVAQSCEADLTLRIAAALSSPSGP
jgi:hypothetical protein